MSSTTVDVPKTFGALLLGALFASVLSGTVLLQTLFYFKNCTEDYSLVRTIVTATWLLDTAHTAFIWSSIWEYLIKDYGVVEDIDTIPWSIALTIICTAILTFLIHCFFAYRIFMLSKRNLYITVPIVVLAVMRLASASVTTGEMVRLRTFSTFREKIAWVFTLGLSLSSLVDILITGSMFYLLQTSRSKMASLNLMIDKLILYTFETGSLTCAATIVSMICWIAMPTNFIFMALHFIVAKLYANSLLVALNTRKRIRNTSAIPRFIDCEEPNIVVLNSRGQQASGQTRTASSNRISKVPPTASEIQINVEQTVSQTVDFRRFSGTSDPYYAFRQSQGPSK